FTVVWTAGMLWLGGTPAPAGVIITVIAGCVAGYLWYRLMRWFLVVRQVPSQTPSGRRSRKMAGMLTNRWTEWTIMMVLTGFITAELRGYTDPLIPAGAWHGLLSGLFVVVVWPTLAGLCGLFFRRYPQGLLSLLLGRPSDVVRK
ncbi:MAG TPA: hypothetical protein VGD75_17680, partial [Bradyrhizobium sp.]